MILRGQSCATFYREAAKAGSGKFCSTIVSRETDGSARELGLCHMKQPPQKMNKEILLTYTKLSEDHIKDIFHIHPAEQPPKGMGRDPQMLRSEFLALPQCPYTALQ